MWIVVIGCCTGVAVGVADWDLSRALASGGRSSPPQWARILVAALVCGIVLGAGLAIRDGRAWLVVVLPAVSVPAALVGHLANRLIRRARARRP
jgi:hypothetical protein